METARTRLVVPMVLFALGFGFLLVRLMSIGMFGELSETTHFAAEDKVDYIAGRADIVDRNGIVLATNLKTSSLAARPRMISEPEELATEIAAILKKENRTEILNKLKSSRRHVWISRKLTPKEVWQINSLGNPALELEEEEERVYPQGNLAAHVLGYVGIDTQPFAGVERFFQDHLSDPLRSGEPLVLSLDIRVQHILHSELKKSMDKFQAAGAAGLVMDVHTGEILALSSLPDFDPNSPPGGNSKALFNKLTQGVYEMGSGFKTFTVAMALEEKVVNLEGGYDATEPLKVDRFTIHDDHAKKRWLNVPEIYTYSSNIGSALMARDVGVEYQRDFLQKIGMFEAPGIELSGVASPLLPRQWGEVESMTVSYGHGIAITPVQLATGVAAMINGGRHIPATLLRKSDSERFLITRGGSDSEAPRVISKETSRTMRDLMRLAVEYGTGGGADVEGYFVGGKTGTAEKPGAGGYRKKDLISSFIGAFPMDDPRYVVFAMLDEPKGTEETFYMASGGWTAAPLVGEVVRQIGPLLGVAPEKRREPRYRNLILTSADRDKHH
ncbi:penicillin-binding protein 2 [Emcibacter nanhaiensis]|uniref:Penicillin-binding protein 2 n=2 Tax=Emcibacter nanhaiensis TaxID=1505037 RepID=A0A501PCS2_9PROT|nr:penicillin-binding protein 2 [Emcibacter nanhaiensis]